MMGFRRITSSWARAHVRTSVLKPGLRFSSTFSGDDQKKSSKKDQRLDDDDNELKLTSTRQKIKNIPVSALGDDASPVVEAEVSSEMEEILEEEEEDVEEVSTLPQTYRQTVSTVEPDELKNDPSWPIMIGETQFEDLLFEFPFDKEQEIMTEALKQMGHQPFEDMVLPKIDVEIPETHEQYEGLSLMKQSLFKNPYIPFDQKDRLMRKILHAVDFAEDISDVLVQTSATAEEIDEAIEKHGSIEDMNLFESFVEEDETFHGLKYSFDKERKDALTQ